MTQSCRTSHDCVKTWWRDICDLTQRHLMTASRYDDAVMRCATWLMTASRHDDLTHAYVRHDTVMSHVAHLMTASSCLHAVMRCLWVKSHMSRHHVLTQSWDVRHDCVMSHICMSQVAWLMHMCDTQRHLTSLSQVAYVCKTWWKLWVKLHM